VNLQFTGRRNEYSSNVLPENDDKDLHVGHGSLYIVSISYSLANDVAPKWLNLSFCFGTAKIPSAIDTLAKLPL
jgi:hypothetical protein